jgi:predicted nucleic acid-binding protein
VTIRRAVIDTNVYIDYWERGLRAEAVADIHASYLVRHSAVVLSELRRGARTPAARRTIEGLHRLAAEIWEPSAEDWWEAGRLVREVGDQQDWETNKRREFQNDALVALTARRHGATVVTSNAGDFTLLARRIRFQTVYV